MSEAGVGSVVVCDAAGAPLGIVTDRDLRNRVIAAALPVETPVRAIMTPRPNVRGLDVSWPADQIVRAAAEHSRSRLPVFRDSIDEPIGFVTIKDLFAVLARGEAPVIERLVRPALFVPEAMPVGALRREFRRRHAGIALVVDEYGSVMGLITIEDVLEEIVGEVREEYEGPHLPFAVRLPDGAEVPRDPGAHHLIGDARQEAAALHATDRYGDDHARRSLPPYRFHRGAHGRAGGETVVDEDDHAVVDVDGRAVAAVRLLAPAELADFAFANLCQRLLVDAS